MQDEAALRQRLAVSELVISVPPAGQESRMLRNTPGEAPPLPPEVEVKRQTALIGWKMEAQQLLTSCVARPEQDRRPVALEVMFAPLPRASEEGRQVFMPDWVQVPSHELQRLWQDTDADALEECIHRVRSLTMVVPLSGEALAHDFHASAESVLVHL